MTVFNRLHHRAQQTYAWLEKHWFDKLVYTNSPLVRVLDFTTGSECKYCMATRALILGLGFGLAVSCGLSGAVGVVLMLLAVFLTLAENSFSKKE